MINMLVGPPGGGKSYEAVVYHVLPTIEQGRKIITNLPLNLDELAKIEPRAPGLIELRHKSKRDGYHPFGCVEDYGDDWRHKDTNIGPLYVIDECHKALPRLGIAGATPESRKVDEWYAEHRHEGADVLLMTQSYGKVSKAITDQIQILYRVKKMTAFGQQSAYIRKVQEGTKGEVMSTAERVYQPKYFRLYKSHTRTEAAVIEQDAKDISPAFKKWQRASWIVFALGALACIPPAMSFFGDDDEPKAQPASAAAAARTKEHGRSRAASGEAVGQGHTSKTSPTPAQEPALPTESETLRLVGVAELGPASSHAVIYSRDREFRVPLYLCNRQPFTGWTCSVDGQIVTATTGEAPPQIEPRSIAASVVGSITGS